MENSFPSPIAQTLITAGDPNATPPTSDVFSYQYPTGAGNALGWSAPKAEYFHDISNKIPGTVGPVRYWSTIDGSFKGA